MPIPSRLDLEETMIRETIKELIPYKVTQIENVVRLDANENSNNLSFMIDAEDLNRYPDNDASTLKKAIASYLSVDQEEIIVGNGSSEMIELLMKTYIEAGDNILGFDISFSMYKIFAKIYGADYISVSNDNYVMDMDDLINQAILKQPKLILICNPNNPTGYLINKTDIERLCKSTKSLVVVDEAYIEFCEGSMINRLGDYDNLIILRTFSKAWGLAGARVGYLIASQTIVNDISKVKAPYNLNALSQGAAIKALENSCETFKNVDEIINQREYVYNQMCEMGYKVYKSAANFLYFEEKESLYDELLSCGVLIRAFGNRKYRVTIGSKSDNEMFLEGLQSVQTRMVI